MGSVYQVLGIGISLLRHFAISLFIVGIVPEIFLFISFKSCRIDALTLIEKFQLFCGPFGIQPNLISQQ